MDFEEPTFDPRNKRGSTKKRCSDGFNSSDTGVRLTPEQEIFYQEKACCEGADDEISEEEAEEQVYRAQRHKKGYEKTQAAYAEENLARGINSMSRQKRQLLRAAATDLSKDDLRRLAMALLVEM